MLADLLPELRDVTERIKELKAREATLRKTCLDLMAAENLDTYTADYIKLKAVRNARQYDASMVLNQYPKVYEVCQKPAVDTERLRAAIEYFEIDENEFNSVCSTVKRSHLRVTLSSNSED